MNLCVTCIYCDHDLGWVHSEGVSDDLTGIVKGYEERGWRFDVNDPQEFDGGILYLRGVCPEHNRGFD